MSNTIQVLTQALKQAKPEPWKGNPGTYRAALSEWNTTVTIVADSLAQSEPKFSKEEFYKASGYWTPSEW